MKKLKDVLVDKKPLSSSNGITDPSQLGQYSATNLTKESAGLDSYLSAKGINPKFVSRSTKIGHSKSSDFQKWKRDHMKEDMTKGKDAGEPRSKQVDSPTAQRQSDIKKSIKHYTVKPVSVPTSMKKEGSQTTAITPESVQIDELSAKKLYVYINKASKDPKHDKGVMKATGKYIKTQEEVDMVNEDTEVHGERHYVQSFGDNDHRVFHQYHSYTQNKDGRKAGWNSVDQQISDKQEKHSSGHISQTGNVIKHKTAKDAHEKAAKLNHEAGIPNPTHTHRTNDKIEIKNSIYNGMPSHPSTHEYTEPPKHVKEDFDAINEISKKTLGSYVKAAHADVVQRASSASYKSGAAGDTYNKADDTPKEKKRMVGIQKAVGRLAKEDFEQIDELSKDTLKSYQSKRKDSDWSNKRSKKGRERFEKMRNGILGANSRLMGFKPTSEDTLDPKAADGAAADGTSTGDAISERRKQLSKSARMIKALYKSKRMYKEDMYDHEKEDKSVATYGKKPKHEKADEKDSKGDKKPTAAAILTGGTTLTGEKRDDIEIDPMMRSRPGQPDPTKPKEKDKDKKDSKKEEKK